MSKVSQFSRDLIALGHAISAYNHHDFYVKAIASGTLNPDPDDEQSRPSLSEQFVDIRQQLESLQSRRSLMDYFTRANVRSGNAAPFEHRHTSLHGQWLTLAGEWVDAVEDSTGGADSNGHWSWGAGCSEELEEWTADLEVEAAVAAEIAGDEANSHATAPAALPTLTPKQQRMKFCAEMSEADKSYSEINAALKDHPTLQAYSNDRGVRSAIDGWYRHTGKARPRRKPGRRPKDR